MICAETNILIPGLKMSIHIYKLTHHSG